MTRLMMLLTVLLPTPALAWGVTSHRELAKHMQDALPPDTCLRQWVESLQSSSFQKRAADPDAWRSTDPEEGPRHYLDVDVHKPAEDYPRDWPEVAALYRNRAVEYGLLPWHVETLYGDLVTAFAAQNETKLKQWLPWFSHYVMDGFSPLHNTINYNPNDLHLRYEDLMFDTSNNLASIIDASAAYIGTPGRAHPKHHMFDIIIVGSSLVDTLIAADRAAFSGNQYRVQTFFNGAKDLSARRFGDAITLFGSLLASAWVDAGSPVLSGMPAGCNMKVPQGDVELLGYPVPGGFTYVEPKPEAPEESGGCSALGTSEAALVGAALLLVLRLRRLRG